MKTLLIALRMLLLLAFAVGISAPSLWAQATPTEATAGNDTGVRAYTAYSGARENVNLTNGNLNVSIPLISLPGRDGHNFTLSLLYDSKNWVVHGNYSGNGVWYYNWQWEARPPQVGAFGWRLDIPCISGGAPIYDPYTSGLIGYGDYIVTLPGGGKATVSSKVHGADSEDGSFLSLYSSSLAP